MGEERIELNYEKWKRVVFVSQMIMAVSIFFTELSGNIILYATHSEGYTQDTIVGKFLRYFVLTSIINFGTLWLSQILVRKIKKLKWQKLILILSTEIIFTDVAYSHYQFAATFAVFTIPILLSILFEDKHLCHITLLMSTCGLTLAVAARATDPIYNTDIALDASVGYVLTISVYLLSKKIMGALTDRRDELENALLASHKIKIAESQTQMSYQMLETLARAIDAKDRYTNGHSVRVASYAVKLAKELGWSEQEVENLKYESLLHDIGKIGVPDSVLNKPGRLTDLEFKLIQSHTLIGADILKDMITIPGAESVARFHHERYDGKGYPNQLCGDAIPLNARVVGIADAFDAMNSDRIYRKALPKEVIREELIKGRGTQFDPELLDVFLRLFDTDSLEETVDVYLPGRENSLLIGNLLEDIENVIKRMSSQDEVKDFAQFFDYMRKLGMRYQHSVEVISIIIAPNEGITLSEEEMKAAAKSLEIATKKNIRSVDVYTGYSLTKHLVILLDAGEKNLDTIVQRISYDFYKMQDIGKLALSYEVNAMEMEKLEED